MLFRAISNAAEAIVRGLVAMGGAVEIPESQVAEPVEPYPKTITVTTPNGQEVRVRANEPLNPRWYPGTNAGVLGVSVEPSNGADFNPPLPLRSPSGFPLMYAKVGNTYIDTPSVCIGDVTFNSEELLMRWLNQTSVPLTQAPAGFYAGGGERSSLTPELLAEFKAQQSDRDRGVWLNNHSPQVAKELLAGDHMSHEQSTAAFNAAQGYKV